MHALAQGRVLSSGVAPVQQALPHDGDELLQHIIAPCSADEFFDTVWEQRPLLVSRPSCPSYYSSWYSKAALVKLLHTGKLQYGLNLDVTHYDGRVRPLQQNLPCTASQTPCGSAAWRSMTHCWWLVVGAGPPEPQWQPG